jgi:hypothetical protein
VTDEEYLTRVAVHGSIPDDVPGDIEVTNEERDAIVEVLYVRPCEEYGVYSRHRQSLYLDHDSGPFDEFDDGLESAIETARGEGLPLLRRVYSWVPVSEADELGSDRIPIPWTDDDEDADG